MAQITIDTEQVSKLCRDAEGFVFDPESEKALAQIMAIYDNIGRFIEQVKSRIAEKALAVDENFSGARGETLKVEYRAFGAMYKVEDADAIDDEFKTVKTSVSLNSKAIDKYVEANGVVPAGVARADRKKQLTIKRIAE